MLSRSRVEEKSVNKNSWYCFRENRSVSRKKSRNLPRFLMALGAAALLLPFALAAVPAQNAKPAGTGNADKGKLLFESAGCASCHGNSAKGISGVGPLITPPPFAIPEFINFVRHPSGTMRPFSQQELSDAQLGDIHAYLQSLSPSSDSNVTMANLTGNAENGKRLFMRDGCYECHGNLGQGANGYGTRIAPDPISMQGIRNYIRNPSGKIVPDQDVADIYAYLKSVPRPVDIKNIPLFTK
jgi:mono/diheme cytochrome c family protein